MEKVGFKLSKAVPCFMNKKNEKGICMMSIYVHDMDWLAHEKQLMKQLAKSNPRLTA